MCAGHCWTKERDYCWQGHLAVKAPLFNSQTTAALHLCYWSIEGPRHLKFVPDSLEKCWVYNLDLSAVLMHAVSHVFLLHSGLLLALLWYLSLFFNLHPAPCPFPPPLLSACVYYSSKRWQQDRHPRTLNEEICNAPLLMPDLLFVWEKPWWRKGETIEWKAGMKRGE